jgi:hypothetical protein
MFDEQLRAFATERQREILDAFDLYGSNRATAKALGCHESVVRRAMKALKIKAARQGFSPEHDMTRPVPEGFIVKGVSTYYNRDFGEIGRSNFHVETMMEARK